VHPAERLAAYLADELPPDERVALEADLARDADLRTQLEHMRAADAVLADLPPTALPDGARDRLLDAVRGELDDQLGPAETPDAAGAATVVPAAEPTSGDGPRAEDTFTARRRRRDAQRRQVPWAAIGGVAAGLIGVVVVVTNLQGVGGDSAGDTAADAPATESLEAPAEDGAGGPDGPVLLAQGREIDAEVAEELLADATLEAVAGQALDADEAATVGQRYAAALGASAGDDRQFGTTSSDGLTADTEEDAAEPEEAPAPEASPAEPAELTVVGDVDDTDRAAVATCLDELLADGTTAVPATAELVTFDGEPAVAYGLVSLSPDDDAATRREVWVLTRDGCEVRYFGQS
jgi:hypothetical protein